MFPDNRKLGVLGGGQLGRMLLQAASDWALPVAVLDPDPQAPGRPLAQPFVQGDFGDHLAVWDFGQGVDVLTVEIEQVSIAGLAALRNAGKAVYPSPEVLALIQDKGRQKEFFTLHSLPTAAYRLLENPRAQVEEIRNWGPGVLKLRQGGYDGRGVQLLEADTPANAYFDQPSLWEVRAPIAQELSLLAARNPRGEIRTYPLVAQEFNPKANLVEFLYLPAQLDPALVRQAEELGRSVLEQLDYVGLLAVELFLTTDNTLLINELAPRPHNSGHPTIEACWTSQFQQHLRAVLDLPLGHTGLRQPAAMLNLLGADGQAGTPLLRAAPELLQETGAYLHNYAKTETRPWRKMGHVTLVGQDLEELKRRARAWSARLQVGAQ